MNFWAGLILGLSAACCLLPLGFMLGGTVVAAAKRKEGNSDNP